MSYAKLSIDLDARLANLQAGLDKAGLLAERSADRMRGAFTGASRALAATGAALGAVFTVQALSRWISSTADGVDALNDLADATGASVAKLSALEDLAIRTSGSFDGAADMVLKLTKALGEADDSDAGKALAALNLNIKELRQLDPVDAMQKIATALQGVAGGAVKARVVRELFGKDLAQVAPLLKDMAEAGQLQAKVTAEQAAEVEKFNKQLFELQKHALDLSRALLGPVVSGFNAMAQAMRDVDAEREKGKGWWQALNEGLAKRFPQFAFGLQADQILGRAPTEFTRGNFLRGDKDTTPVQTQLRDPFGKPARPAAAARKELFEPFGPEPSPALLAVLQRIDDADENKLARLRQELDQMLSIVAGGGSVPDSAITGLVEDITQLDPAARAAQTALDKLAKDQARLNAIMAETPTGKLQSMLDQIAFLNQQFAAGNIQNVEQWAEAVRQVTGTLDNDVTVAADKSIDVARELGLTFSSAFEDAVVSGQSFRDILDGIEKDLLRIFSRKLVTEPLAEWASGAIGGLIKGGGGDGAGFGGILKDLFSGFFADGGFIPPGRWGMAGERGPEPVFGGRTGLTVQPAAGVSVVNHFHLAGPADMRTQQQIAAATARSVERAARRNN